MRKGLGGRIRDNLEKEGFLRTVGFVAREGVARLVSIFYIRKVFGVWAIDLTGIQEYMETAVESYHCRDLQSEDLPAIESAFASSVREDAHAKMRTSSGYVIFEGRDLIGYGWSTKLDVHESGIGAIKNEGMRPILFDVYPKAGVFYIYGEVILPAKRGRGANTRLFHYRLWKGRQAGFKKTFGFVAETNYPQIRILEKFGGVKVGLVEFKKFLWGMVKEGISLDELCDLKW